MEEKLRSDALYTIGLQYIPWWKKKPLFRNVFFYQTFYRKVNLLVILFNYSKIKISYVFKLVEMKYVYQSSRDFSCQKRSHTI